MWSWLTGSTRGPDNVGTRSQSAAREPNRERDKSASSSTSLSTTRQDEALKPNSRKRKRGSFFFGIGSAVDEGVGWGGYYGGDRKKLLKGRKAASERALEEQAETEVYLSQVCADLQSKVDTRSTTGPTMIDPSKLSLLLKEIFRNPETDSSLFRQALTCVRLLAGLQDWAISQTTMGNADDKNSLCHVFRQFAQQETFLARHGNGKKDIVDEVEDVLSMVETKTTEGTREDSGEPSSCERESKTVTTSQSSQRQKDLVASDSLLIVTEQEYCSTLGPMRFSFVSELDQHVFGSDNKRRPKRLDMRKTFRELSSYSQNLPVAWGSSILVRAVESRIDLLRALIFGPEGTPYENGCFFFDIYLGGSENNGCYPKGPPDIKFLNTAGGRIQMNPHLHRDGKVCLSLLGTWPIGPGWVSGESTLLQVLVSLQSMIFVNNPITMGALLSGTRFGRRVTEECNNLIRKYTCLYAIQPFLQSNNEIKANASFPYPEFADAVKEHFRHKNRRLQMQLDEWVALDKGLERTAQNLHKTLTEQSGHEPTV